MVIKDPFITFPTQFHFPHPHAQVGTLLHPRLHIFTTCCYWPMLCISLPIQNSDSQRRTCLAFSTCHLLSLTIKTYFFAGQVQTGNWRLALTKPKAAAPVSQVWSYFTYSPLWSRTYTVRFNVLGSIIQNCWILCINSYFLKMGID